MADLLPSRPMEAFFIHPTMADDIKTLCAGLRGKDDDCWPNPDHTMPSDGDKPAIINGMINHPMALKGYTSEEETASPIDDDSISYHSNESYEGEVCFPEALAQNCSKVEQQWKKAQAVTIQSAGKAKVVSLRKLVDIPARRGVVRPASIKPQRISTTGLDSTEQMRSARSSSDSCHQSVNSSVANSPASTAPSSIILEQQIELKRTSSRHIPLMEAARLTSPSSLALSSLPCTPLTPRPSILIRGENTLSSQSFVCSSPTAAKKPSIKRMTKFSPNFSLNRISKELRETLSPRADTFGFHLEDVKEPESVQVAQQTLQPPPTPRFTSMRRPKMVARAANERAPTIELPPFPGELDSNDWPLRKNSTFPPMGDVNSRLALMA